MLTLKKEERLSSFKEIENLVLKGNSFFLYPFKINYISIEAQEGEQNISIVISVPKRNFKRAVKRNLLKRRIRESYRLNKEEIANASGNKLNIMFVYVSKEVMDYGQIESKVKEILEKINTSVNK